MRPPDELGVVCTFYSYKGGVGRTLALANCGVQLARWGYRTLLVDWDFEAPGLYAFFDSHISADHAGLGHLIARSAGSLADWPSAVSETSVPDTADRLHMLAPSPTTNDYLEVTRPLDWHALYSAGIGDAIENMATEWRREYDFILVDSRTGVNDIGAICTAQIPDIVVLLTTASQQSFEGVTAVARAAQAARAALPRDLAGILFLPILARFEGSVEVDLSRNWIARLQPQFDELTNPWRPVSLPMTDLMTALRIPYVPRWSFGEELPILSEDGDDPSTISYSFQTIAALIAHRLSETEVLATGRDTYVASARATDRTGVAPPRRYDVFLSYEPDDGPIALLVIDRLQSLGLRVWGGTASASGTPEQSDALATSAALVPLVRKPPTLAQQEEYRQFLIRSLVEAPSSPLTVLPVLLTDREDSLPPNLRSFQLLRLHNQSDEQIAEAVATALRRPSASTEAVNDLNSFVADAFNRWHAASERDAVAADRFSRGYWVGAYRLIGAMRPVSLNGLRDALRGVASRYSGWPPWFIFDRPDLAPYVNEGMLECWLKTTQWRDAAHSDFWVASPDGGFFVLRGYQEDSEPTGWAPGAILDLTIPIVRTAEVMLHANAMARVLADETATIAFHFEWRGLSDRQLVAWARPSHYISEHRAQSDRAVSTLISTAPRLRTSLVEEVQHATTPLYQTFELFQLPKETIQSEVQRLGHDDANIVSSGNGGSEVDAETADEGPGLIDVLASGEAALPEWVSHMNAIAEIIKQVGALTSAATAELEKEKTFAGRLSVARKLAGQLSYPAERLEDLTDEYGASVQAVDPAIRALLQIVRDDPSQARDNPDVVSFLNQLPEMARNSKESDSSMEGLISALDASARVSRDMRAPVRRMQTALRKISTANTVIDEWAREREGLDV